MAKSQGDDVDPSPEPTPNPSGSGQSKKRRPVRDGLGFFGSFLKNPTSVGAVLPSSRFLSRALVGSLDHIQEGELVVEYGPGTGPMTAIIKERLPWNARYLGIELQPEFHELLCGRFSGMDFHLGSAGDVKQILADRGLPRPVRIISGLPFASLPIPVQDSVVDGLVWALEDSECDFRTFQYAHAYGMKSARRFRSRMGERFEHFERIGPIVRNVPPAFVLRYRGVK
ncbi:MAG: phosphatidylethanolamine/phosphatidyl-N-methylethanolamine N-methyltransferase [Planctomycetota bacterium]|jgi:phosphatidylethanolamine/phosphatidyl-N-methylethanolamine N-methyltransferase